MSSKQPSYTPSNNFISFNNEKFTINEVLESSYSILLLVFHNEKIRHITPYLKLNKDVLLYADRSRIKKNPFKLYQ